MILTGYSDVRVGLSFWLDVVFGRLLHHQRSAALPVIHSRTVWYVFALFTSAWTMEMYGVLLMLAVIVRTETQGKSGNCLIQLYLLIYKVIV